MTPYEYSDEAVVLEYCLGLLPAGAEKKFKELLERDAELANEIKQVKFALEAYVSAQYRIPQQGLREKVLTVLDYLAKEKNLDLTDLPAINKYSDAQAWYSALSHLLPDEKKGLFFLPICINPAYSLLLISSARDIPEEVHDNLTESFIVLEGECECHIGGHLLVARKGDYIEVPKQIHHSIRLLSPYVVAVRQQVAA